MPMIELTTTKGALDDAAKQRLAAELSTIALELEAAPLDFGGAAHMQALSWCFVNEQDVFVGGRRHTKPIYRVTVTIPDGAPGLSGGSGGRREREHDRFTRRGEEIHQRFNELILAGRRAGARAREF